jgi:hypothetical protein
MPTFATAMPLIGSLATSAIGSAVSAGSNSGGSTSDTTRSGTQTNEYMNQWTDAQKSAIWQSIMDKINATYLSGNKQLSNNLASRGLGGGMLASGLAGNQRAKEETASGAATNIEAEGNKQIIKSVRTDGTGTTTNTNTEGSFGNSMGNTLSDIGGMGSAYSIAKWLRPYTGISAADPYKFSEPWK